MDRYDLMPDTTDCQHNAGPISGSAFACGADFRADIILKPTVRGPLERYRMHENVM